MPRNKKINYIGDRVQDYSLEELIDLYVAEGKTRDEAKNLAKDLFGELKTLNYQTINVWRRARNR